MEGEENFALIEEHKRQIQYVYVPIEWNKSIKETFKKLFVTQITSADFFLFSDLALTNKKEKLPEGK